MQAVRIFNDRAGQRDKTTNPTTTSPKARRTIAGLRGVQEAGRLLACCEGDVIIWKYRAAVRLAEIGWRAYLKFDSKERSARV
jgi:hypothetical protein